MSDDTKNVGREDRERVAADQNHEVAYLAGKFNLTAADVRAAIAKHGPLRRDVEGALEILRTDRVN